MHKINSIFISVLCIGLISCSTKNTKQLEVVQLPQTQHDQSISPGAPGMTPYWAYSGKTGIGTSYEAYHNGQYSADAITGNVSKVWFSLAQGVITETMYGLIHQAQIKDLQFVVKGDGFVATELDDTTSKIEYLTVDDAGRPLSLAYKVTNTDKLGRFEIEKHIFTDPDNNTLFIRTYFTALKGELTAYVAANPYVNNNGLDDSAKVVDGKLIAMDKDNFVTLSSDKPFVTSTVGFVGVSDGLTELKRDLALNNIYQSTGDKTGNVALFAELGSFKERTNFDLALGFGTSENLSTAAANASLNTGYQKVLDNYNGVGAAVGWSDYLASLSSLTNMRVNTMDEGKLLNTSAMVLKAQEDKTHAGALIASLSNPWGDTVKAEKGHTGYKAVWVRDFYQVAMAFLALGDDQTAKTAFTYLKKVQVTKKLKENHGDTGWFLQKTHVDGEVEWVGVQLDQTAMPIMLAWKLWQADVLTNEEVVYWYNEMLKPAADFLVDGGLAKILWNDTQITPPITQQERWEEQSGYSPSTTAAIIAGLITASDIAKLAGDKSGIEKYLKTAKKYSAEVEDIMYTTEGHFDSAEQGYFFRLGKDKDANSDTPLGDNNGRVGANKKDILDGGFLELVRYGVRKADDKHIISSLHAYDDESLTENLRVKYSFSFPGEPGSYPGWRRYGNDGYGEDEVNGQNYGEKGSNTLGQRGRVWPFFTGERAHYELASHLMSKEGLSKTSKNNLKNTYVKALELFANEGMMLPEQVWDNVGVNPQAYKFGEGTNSATPLAWTHAEYLKLLRSLTDEKVWDHYPLVENTLQAK